MSAREERGLRALFDVRARLGSAKRSPSRTHGGGPRGTPVLPRSERQRAPKREEGVLGGTPPVPPVSRPQGGVSRGNGCIRPVVEPRGERRSLVWTAGRATQPDGRRRLEIRRRKFLNQNQPDLKRVTVRCTTCGHTFTTHSTRGNDIVVDVCSNCHPAYTGVERTRAGGGRIERFERRRALTSTRQRRSD